MSNLRGFLAGSPSIAGFIYGSSAIAGMVLFAYGRVYFAIVCFLLAGLVFATQEKF